MINSSRLTCSPKFVIAIVGTLFLCCATSAPDNAFAGEAVKFDAKARIWTDDTGKHEIEARLIEYKDQIVTLKKNDDSNIELSVSKLSKADRRYLGDMLRAARTNNVDRNSDVKSAPENIEGKLKADAPENGVDIKNADGQEKFGIEWHEMDQSIRIANAEKKPIMWFRVLGDLDGFM